MSAKITKQYPKNGTQLNKIFKPYYKTLAKIKKKQERGQNDKGWHDIA